MPFPNPDTQFKPGQSGNPKGKAKGVEHSKTRYLKLLNLVQKKKNSISGELEELSVIEQMDLKVVAKALDGDLAAYRELLDRLEGKPTPTDETPTELSIKYEVVNRVPEPKE